MKKLYTIIIAAICSANIHAQTYQWAKRAGGTNSDYSAGITTDAVGNSYVVGTFYSPSITFGSTTLTNSFGLPQIFVVKYDPLGNPIWAKSDGSSIFATGAAITTDKNGYIYVAGSFPVSGSFGGVALTTNGGTDMFFAKYDTSGTVLMAKSAGGSGDDQGKSIAVDANGNILVTGIFQSPTMTIGSDTLTYSGGTSNDVFVVKYNSAGNPLWARGGGGTDEDDATSITTGIAGKVYATGYFVSNTIKFGSQTLAHNATTLGGNDPYLVIFDSLGVLLSAQNGTNSDNGGGQSKALGITSDVSGNIYLTGDFGAYTTGNITFGSITIQHSTTTSTTPGQDMFLFKFSSSGNAIWGRSSANTDKSPSAQGWGVATDASGNINVIGNFLQTAIAFGSDTVTSAGSMDAFIVKYDSSGNLLCATGIGGSTIDHGWGIATDANGNAYITGDFSSSSVTLGSTTLTNANSSGSYPDVYVAKLNCGSPTGIREQENANDFLIFPNPTSGLFQITSGELRITNVEIYNVYGEKVYSSIINNHSSLINLNSPIGIYFLQLKTEQGIVNKKIIINK